MAVQGAYSIIAGNGAESARVRISNRVTKLREDFLSAMPSVCGERSHLYTEYWKRSEGEPIAIRRAKAFEYILKNKKLFLHDGEMIVGSQTKYRRGGSLYPEFCTDWIEEELEMLSSRETSKFELAREDRDMILEDLHFWKGRTVKDHLLPLWKEQWGSLVEDGVATRMSFVFNSPAPHGRQVINFPKVLNKGLSGIIEEAQGELSGHLVLSNEGLHKRYFWEAVIIACNAVITFAKRYAELLEEKAANEDNPARKQELEEMAGNLRQVPAGPARTFHQAVQATWLAHLAVEIENNSWGYSPGRLDQYLYPFYKKDVEEGRIGRDEARELLGCLWIKFAGIELLHQGATAKLCQGSVYQNVTIGGQTEEGEDATNELSYLILEVEQEIKLSQPTLSLRYFDGLKEEFLLKCAEVIKSGGGKPAIFCDKYALKALSSYGVPEKEARTYAPTGCVEMSIPYSSTLFFGGFLSVPKCLELALNNGKDPLTGVPLGPETGDPRTFKDYDELIHAFETQLAAAAEWVINTMNTFYAPYPDLVPTPFNSALVNDCIKSGKDINEGGARYKNLMATFPIGMVTAGNSLTALKKLVFEDKVVDMGGVIEALKANFEGQQELHGMLMHAPKYGNDDDYADSIVNGVFKMVKDAIYPHYTNPWGESVAFAYLGVTAHYFHGQTTGATPDGRRARTPYADGSLSAYPGTDSRGPTAVIKSATKVDLNPALASLFNLKYHPAALNDEDRVKKFWALVKTYAEMGGYHIQFNVVDRETLLDAQRHPENYKDLVVRLAGFSVFFVELSPQVQMEIISRTEHTD
jgi:formate C-acetyltransferase